MDPGLVQPYLDWLARYLGDDHPITRQNRSLYAQAVRAAGPTKSAVGFATDPILLANFLRARRRVKLMAELGVTVITGVTAKSFGDWWNRCDKAGRAAWVVANGTAKAPAEVFRYWSVRQAASLGEQTQPGGRAVSLAIAPVMLSLTATAPEAPTTFRQMASGVTMGGLGELGAPLGRRDRQRSIRASWRRQLSAALEASRRGDRRALQRWAAERPERERIRATWRQERTTALQTAIGASREQLQVAKRAKSQGAQTVLSGTAAASLRGGVPCPTGSRRDSLFKFEAQAPPAGGAVPSVSALLAARDAMERERERKLAEHRQRVEAIRQDSLVALREVKETKEQLPTLELTPTTPSSQQGDTVEEASSAADSARENREAHQEQIEQLEDALDSLKERLAEAELKLQNGQAPTAEMGDLKRRIDELMSELAKAREEQLEAAEKATETGEAKLKVLQDEIESLKAQLAQAPAAQQVDPALVTSLQSQIDTLNAELGATQAALSEAREAEASSQQDIAELPEEIEVVAEQIQVEAPWHVRYRTQLIVGGLGVAAFVWWKYLRKPKAPVPNFSLPEPTRRSPSGLYKNPCSYNPKPVDRMRCNLRRILGSRHSL